MSAPIDHRRARHGVALLSAVVITTVMAVAIVSLWQVAAAARRSARWFTSVESAAALADSSMSVGLRSVADGHWRSLSAPGAVLVAADVHSQRSTSTVSVGRVAWSALLVRAQSISRTGTLRLPSRADRRMLIPLTVPMQLPRAALTTGQPATIATGASVDVPFAGTDERVCRDGQAAVASRTGPWVAVPALQALPAVDPDTVRGTLVGAYRLTRATVGVPLTVHGMVELDTDLFIGADLRVTGVLLVRGSIRPAGGRLEVTGAVIAGDSTGGHSGLGSTDRVRYDACAIRRAVDQLASPVPTGGWTSLRLF